MAKGRKALKTVKKSGFVSLENLNKLKDPSKAMENLKNLDPNKIKEEMEKKIKANADKYANISGKLDELNKLKESTMNMKDTLTEPLLLQDKFNEMKNNLPVNIEQLNIDQAQNTFQNIKNNQNNQINSNSTNNNAEGYLEKEDGENHENHENDEDNNSRRFKQYQYPLTT